MTQHEQNEEELALRIDRADVEGVKAFLGRAANIFYTNQEQLAPHWGALAQAILSCDGGLVQEVGWQVDDAATATDDDRQGNLLTAFSFAIEAHRHCWGNVSSNLKHVKICLQKVAYYLARVNQQHTKELLFALVEAQ